MASFSRASADRCARAPDSARGPAAGRDSNSTRVPATAPRRSVLAIDYGRRRMGLAVSDVLGLTVHPLATWTRVNRRRDLARLRDLCREHSVDIIVVGWPINLDGSQSEMAREAARFAERIRKNLGLRTELADERLSSWEAGQLVTEAELPRRSQDSRRRRKPVDDIAAALILRDYLSHGISVPSRAPGRPPTAAGLRGESHMAGAQRPGRS